ncbi:MAG: regulatory iron-sulfur-containing complex subunit RicT, partial [Rikenellaceae bacterium]
LCCSSWISNFVSVTTNAARYQEISLNPQKLAGQCGKLKCCLIYELDTYMDARKEIPRIHQPLETLDGTYHLVKTDIFKKIMWFSSDPHGCGVQIPVPVSRVREILAVNRKGNKVDILVEETIDEGKNNEPDYANVVGMDSLTRFDSSSEDGKKGDRRRGNDRREKGDRGDKRTRGKGEQTANAEGTENVAKNVGNENQNMRTQKRNNGERADNKTVPENTSDKKDKTASIDKPNNSGKNVKNNAQTATAANANSASVESDTDNKDDAGSGSNRQRYQNRHRRPKKKPQL